MAAMRWNVAFHVALDCLKLRHELAPGQCFGVVSRWSRSWMVATCCRNDADPPGIAGGAVMSATGWPCGGLPRNVSPPASACNSARRRLPRRCLRPRYSCRAVYRPPAARPPKPSSPRARCCAVADRQHHGLIAACLTSRRQPARLCVRIHPVGADARLCHDPTTASVNVPCRSCDWMLASDATSVPMTDVTGTPGTSPMQVSSDVCASLERAEVSGRSARRSMEP